MKRSDIFNIKNLLCPLILIFIRNCPPYKNDAEMEFGNKRRSAGKGVL
jgi:hypothetical protein